MRATVGRAEMQPAAARARLVEDQARRQCLRLTAGEVKLFLG